MITKFIYKVIATEPVSRGGSGKKGVLENLA